MNQGKPCSRANQTDIKKNYEPKWTRPTCKVIHVNYPPYDVVNAIHQIIDYMGQFWQVFRRIYLVLICFTI